MHSTTHDTHSDKRAKHRLDNASHKVLALAKGTFQIQFCTTFGWSGGCIARYQNVNKSFSAEVAGSRGHELNMYSMQVKFT